MGTFRVAVDIENPLRPGERRTVPAALVDTGSELSWIPRDILEALAIPRRSLRRFRQADGNVLDRWTGPAFLYVAGATATDDVVFAEPSDLTLLGARSLEGLNLTVDPQAKRLVDAGPAPAALASGSSISWMRVTVRLILIGCAYPTARHARHSVERADSPGSRGLDQPSLPARGSTSGHHFVVTEVHHVPFASFHHGGRRRAARGVRARHPGAGQAHDG